MSGGLPGNSRMPPGQGRPPPPGGQYGGDSGYGNPQGYNHSRMDQAAGPGMPRYQEKGSSVPGAGRRVPLKVKKVADEGLRTKLVFDNM